MAALGQMMFKRGVPKTIPKVRNVIPALMSQWVIHGIVTNLVALGVYLYALYSAPLSLVYPTFASSFIFTGLMAHYGFKEELKKTRVLGMVIILIGILIISLTL